MNRKTPTIKYRLVSDGLYCEHIDSGLNESLSILNDLKGRRYPNSRHFNALLRVFRLFNIRVYIRLDSGYPSYTNPRYRGYHSYEFVLVLGEQRLNYSSYSTENGIDFIDGLYNLLENTQRIGGYDDSIYNWDNTFSPRNQQILMYILNNDLRRCTLSGLNYIEISRNNFVKKETPLIDYLEVPKEKRKYGLDTMDISDKIYKEVVEWIESENRIFNI